MPVRTPRATHVPITKNEMLASTKVSTPKYFPTNRHQRDPAANNTATDRPAKNPGRKPAVQINVSINPSVSATPPASTSSKKWTAPRVTGQWNANRAERQIELSANDVDPRRFCLGQVVEHHDRRGAGNQGSRQEQLVGHLPRCAHSRHTPMANTLIANRIQNTPLGTRLSKCVANQPAQSSHSCRERHAKASW